MGKMGVLEKLGWNMQICAFPRFLDGAVYSFILLFVAGMGLFMAGELHKMVVLNETQKMKQAAAVVSKIFPFEKNRYEFNLSHVLLFGLLIALLSMMHHPAQDCYEQEFDKKPKKKRREITDIEDD